MQGLQGLRRRPSRGTHAHSREEDLEADLALAPVRQIGWGPLDQQAPPEDIARAFGVAVGVLAGPVAHRRGVVHLKKETNMTSDRKHQSGSDEHGHEHRHEHGHGR